MCGGKTPNKGKAANSAAFQEHRGGIGGDRKQSENLRFLRGGIPDQEIAIFFALPTGLISNKE